MSSLNQSDYIPEFSESLIFQLLQALAATDKVAYANVTHDDEGNSILDEDGKPIPGKFPRGGPFGAMLVLILEDGKVEFIGKPYGNNVVGSGIASRHAEDQALQDENICLLKTRLKELKAAGHNPFVVMISSGQSCPTCHTKQEILERDLVKHNLLEPRHFFTLYGATYDETFKKAQFYDAQYADALIFKSRHRNHGSNLIQEETIDLKDAPDHVRRILQRAKSPTALVTRAKRGMPGEHVYVTATESRNENDLFATAEVGAVRKACLQKRKEGAFASWEVDGTLYTTGAEIGPLLFAEAGWTHIKRVVHVKMPSQFRTRQLNSRETPNLRNSEFLSIVAGGYYDPDAAIRVVRDEDFHNTAQLKWAEGLKANKQQLYNGSAVSSDVEQTRDAYTRKRFAALDIRNFIDASTCVCGNGPHNRRPLIYLEPLAKPHGTELIA